MALNPDCEWPVCSTGADRCRWGPTPCAEVTAASEYERGKSDRERELAEMHPDDRQRIFDAYKEGSENRLQVVRFGRYSYTWDGDEPLRLGDRCLLPPSRIPGSTAREEIVTGFGTDYDGELSPVTRLISRAAG